MRGNESGETNLKLFFMKIRGLKKGETAYIEQVEALGDKKTMKLDETISKVSGTLKKVDIHEYEFEGKKIQEVKLLLTDPLAGEAYLLGVGLNSIGRGIINTLLGLQQPYGNLEVRIYNRKDNNLPAVYIEHNGVKASWKYTPDDVKQKDLIQEYQVPEDGKMVTRKDYFKLHAFLLDELKQNVMPKLNAAQPSPTPTQSMSMATPAVAASAEADDDLPF